MDLGHLRLLPDHGAQPTGMPAPTTQVIHGYTRAWRIAGSGPAVVLIHGICDNSLTWGPVFNRLARDYTVIAPDLLGHGASDRPRADYSVAGYANGMRDLLSVLDIDSATVVGHSLGGGVAMQFAYQYPERTERLVLVSAGGVGREVNPVLRLAALPGFEKVLAVLELPPVRLQAELLAAVVRQLPLSIATDADDLLRVFESLPDDASRAAFGRTLRSVVDWRGQVVTMLDRCYLASGMPTLLVWGARDPVIPVSHAYRAHEAMPGSRLEVFQDAGHFPFHTDPSRFATVLRRFLRGTAPAEFSPSTWRALLRTGRAPSDLPRAVRARRSAVAKRESVRSAT